MARSSVIRPNMPPRDRGAPYSQAIAGQNWSVSGQIALKPGETRDRTKPSAGRRADLANLKAPLLTAASSGRLPGQDDRVPPRMEDFAEMNEGYARHAGKQPRALPRSRRPAARRRARRNRSRRPHVEIGSWESHVAGEAHESSFERCARASRLLRHIDRTFGELEARSPKDRCRSPSRRVGDRFGRTSGRRWMGPRQSKRRSRNFASGDGAGKRTLIRRGLDDAEA